MDIGMNKLQAGTKTKITFYAVILVFVVLAGYPIFWVVMSSFKDTADMANLAPYQMPQKLYLGNYVTAFAGGKLARYFLNSVIVAACTLLGIVCAGSPAAFAIAKLKFRQSAGLLKFFLMGMMIPVFTCLIPMFQIYGALGLRNTYLSLIFPQIGFSLPMCIFLYVGFMQFVPNELMEAAAIDGASNWRIFLTMIFPMAKNSTVTVVIYNFVNIWNEFTYANTFMTDSKMKTLPGGLNDFVGEMGKRDWGGTFAAITVAILPTMIIYFVLNKQVMEGMAAGAVKS